MMVSTFNSIFAVMDETNQSAPMLLGTAFSIGKGVFATAGHVAESVQSKQATIRRFTEKGTVDPIPVEIVEPWGSVDFGLLYANFIPDTSFSWLDARIVELSDVFSIGFAAGFDLFRSKLTMRHFKGYIVGTQRFSSWTEMDTSRIRKAEYPFWTYELSFPCPKGLSGSPLLCNFPDGVSVVGVIIGSTRAVMSQIHLIETESDGVRTEKYETHDFLHLGQAISSNSLLNGESILLGNIGNTKPNSDTRLSLRKHLGEDFVRSVEVDKGKP